MATEDFHQTAKSWFQIKHTLLAQYLRLFVGKTGRGRQRVYYVDAFAGPGLLDDGTKGSALHAANAAATPLHNSRQDVLRCINIESDEETFEKLQQATASHVEAGHVINLLGRFENRREEVLRLIGAAPALFFIDPFGTDGAGLDSLKALKNGSVIREALVRYDDTRVKRLASWAANNTDSADPGLKKTAKAFDRRIAGLTSVAAIKDCLNDQPGTREALINGYIGEAKRQGIFRFGISYPLRNPDTGGHRYFLVHLSDFEDGYTWMANFMAAADSAYEELHGQLHLLGGQQELITVKDLIRAERENMVDRIVASLPEICIAKGWRNGVEVQNRRIYAALVDKFQWHASRSEWESALRRLRDQGRAKFSDHKDGAGCTLNVLN